MAKITFLDAAQDITIEECLNTFNKGMSVTFDEGRHVTFETEA